MQGETSSAAWLAQVRTALYVPADRPDAMAKAHTRGADALIFDLEDAVAAEALNVAREQLRRHLCSAPPGGGRLLVRVNAGQAEQALDFAALRGCPLDGVLVPKVETTADVDRPRLHARETLVRRDGPPAIVALVESVRGVLRIEALLEAAPWLAAVALGGEDFAVDLGVPRSQSGAELEFPRAWVAAWARANGLAALDTPFIDFRDAAGLAADTRHAAQLGFTGKLVIHPGQVPVVHDAFMPTPAELERARRVVAAAARTERGVAVVDGQMIDAPVIRQAQATLVRAADGASADFSQEPQEVE